MSYGGDEYEYEWPDDGNNDQDGWDENEEEEAGPRVQVENLFYEGEGDMKEKPEAAIELFDKCIELEEGLGDEIVHRFKAMENIIILSARLHKFDKMK